MQAWVGERCAVIAHIIAGVPKVNSADVPKPAKARAIVGVWHQKVKACAGLHDLSRVMQAHLLAGIVLMPYKTLWRPLLYTCGQLVVGTNPAVRL